MRCVSDDASEPFAEPGLALNILGQPKPQQARFYVAQDQSGGRLPAGVDKRAAITHDRGLRGRKCYPHDAGVAGASAASYWDPTTSGTQDPTRTALNGRYREYLRPAGRRGTRDNQNRSILGWVKVGAVFGFALDVTNLSLVELGALLWTLRPDDAFHHRLGGGKPLGFGSVQLQVTTADLRDGRAWRDYYRSLGNTADPVNFDDVRARAVAAFQAAIVRTYGRGGRFDDVTFIQAFLRAGHGFDDRLPVHYPRTRTEGQAGLVCPDPEGESFGWFVQNERREHRLSLPDLAADRGLPYHPKRQRS